MDIKHAGSQRYYSLWPGSFAGKVLQAGMNTLHYRFMALSIVSGKWRYRYAVIVQFACLPGQWRYYSAYLRCIDTDKFFLSQRFKGIFIQVLTKIHKKKHFRKLLTETFFIFENVGESSQFSFWVVLIGSSHGPLRLYLFEGPNAAWFIVTLLQDQTFAIGPNSQTPRILTI